MPVYLYSLRSDHITDLNDLYDKLHENGFYWKASLKPDDPKAIDYNISVRLNSNIQFYELKIMISTMPYFSKMKVSLRQIKDNHLGLDQLPEILNQRNIVEPAMMG